MYEWQPQRVIELVLGSSLVASIGIASLMSLLARRYAFPRMLEGMIAGDFLGSRLNETCAELCKRMNIGGVDLREATVGNAFSLDNKGRKVVAVSPELVSSMSPAEVEAVIAHVHRERELLADQSSVKYTQKPLALASALLKVHSAFHASLPGPGAGLFVGRKAKGLLSRYPDLDRRVQRLIDMAREMKTLTILA